MHSARVLSTLLLVVTYLVPGVAFASGTLLKSEYIKISGEAELGMWYGYRQIKEGPGDDSFSNTLVRAKAAHVPMFTMWSSPECHFCSDVADLFNTTEFQTFLSSQKMVFAYFKSGDPWGKGPGSVGAGTANVASLQAYQYIVESGVPRDEAGDSLTWPYYRFEWHKPDGTVVTTNGSLSVLERACTFEEFKTLLAELAAGYDNKGSFDYFGGAVGVSDSASSRLEAVAGETKSVWVPFRRPVSASGNEADQTVKCAWGGVTNAYPLAWAIGDEQKFIEVAVPDGVAAGDVVSIRVEDLDGALRSEGRIHVISSMGASQENPLWIGEKTADELGWGEWTMDIDVATQKVAAAVAAGTNAYTLALVGGELWCSDCAGMRTNLLVKAEFLDWAASNHVALVLIDVPRNGATCPTMLSWDESGSGAAAVSGAAYLSRKGISPEAAKAIYDRDHELCYSTWNVPYENRARLWVPTLIMLDSNGRPHGKLLGDRKYPNSSFTIATYMRRFDELLALGEDIGEWDNNDWTTTTESFSAHGGTWVGTLCAVDGNTGNAWDQAVVDVAEVMGVAKDDVVAFVFSGDENAKLCPEVITVRSEGGTNVIDKMKGSSFVLSEGLAWSVTNRSEGIRMFLALNRADPVDRREKSKTFFSYSNEGSTVCGYSVQVATALLCGEQNASRVVAAGGLDIKIEEGMVYVLTGVPFGFSTEDFAKIDESNYRALKSGVATIEIGAAGTLNYQVWNPGKVSFAIGEVSVSERAGMARLELRRTGGTSGEAKVRVSYDGGTAVSIADDPENGRFRWDGDRIFVWPEGIATNQMVSIEIFKRTPRWDGDQTVNLSIAPESDSAAGVADPMMCSLTIVEEDVKSAGNLELLPDPAHFSRDGVAYARKGDTLSFSIVRTDGAASTVSASVDVSGGGIVSPASATWESNSADASRLFTLSVPNDVDAGSWICVRVEPSGIGMKRGVDRMFVKVLEEGTPTFTGDASVSSVVSRWVACDISAGLSGTGFAGYRVRKVSGSIPDGIVSEVLGNVFRFAGAPTAVGVFQSVWQVYGIKAAGTEVEGGTLSVNLEVVSQGAVCDAALDEDFPGAQSTYYSGYAADSINGLVCSVSLSATRDGRMRLVADRPGGRSVLTAPRWTSADASALSAALSGDGLSATLVWHRRGDGSCGFDGVLSDGTAGTDVNLVLFRKESAHAKLDAGVYLVDFAPEDDTQGHACASIRIVASGMGQWASYTVVLPDGRPFSGSAAVLAPGDGYCYLPIMGRTASGMIRSLLQLCPGAAGDDRFFGAYNHSVSNAYPSFLDLPAGQETVAMCAQGGYYRAGMDLQSICRISDLTAEYSIGVSAEALDSTFGLTVVDGGIKGSVVADDDMLTFVRDAGDVSRSTFSFDRASGMFSGRFLAVDSSGRKRSLGYRGVIMPNWGEACKVGCGGGTRPGPFKPFGVGAAYMSGQRGVPGIKIVLDPIQKD